MSDTAKIFQIKASKDQLENYQKFIANLPPSEKATGTGWLQRFFDRFTEGVVDYSIEMRVKIENSKTD